MADDLNLDISLEEREAIRSLAKLTRETQSFSSQAVRGFNRLDIAVGNFISSMSSRAVARGLQALNSAFDSIITSGRAFSKAIGEVNTLLPETQKLTIEQTKAFLEFSSTFGGDTATQAKAFYQIVSSGAQGFSNQLKILEVSNKAAVAGISDVATAADVLTSALNTFKGLKVEKAADSLFTAVKEGKTTFGELSQTLGQVAPVAEAAGLSFSEVTGSIAFFTKSGIRTTEAVTGLKAVMTSILKPSAESAALAKKLGLEFNQTALESKGLAAFMADVKEKTKGSSEVLARLFPNVQALTPVFRAVTGDMGDFVRILKASESATGTTNAAFKDIFVTFDFQLEKFNKNISKMGQLLFEVLEPSLTRALMKFNELQTSVNFADFIRGFVTVGKAINIGLVLPIEMAVQTAKIAFNGIKLLIQEIITTTVNTAVDFAETIVDKLPIKSALLDQMRDFRVAANEVLAGFNQDAQKSLSLDNIKFGFANSTNNLLDEIEASGVRVGAALQAMREKLAAGLPDSSGGNPVRSALGFGPPTGESDLEKMIGELDQFSIDFMDRTFTLVDATEGRMKTLATRMKAFSAEIKATMMNGIASGAGNAFAAFGRALITGENALSAFTKALIQSIGQAMVSMGTRFILEGLAFSVHPMFGPAVGGPLVAQGAALATAGGILSAVSGGGAGAGGGLAAGGGGALAPETGGTPITDLPIAEPAAKGVNIVVNVEGNVVDQDEFFSNMAIGLRDAIQKDGAIIEVRA